MTDKYTRAERKRDLQNLSTRQARLKRRRIALKQDMRRAKRHDRDAKAQNLKEDIRINKNKKERVQRRIRKARTITKVEKGEAGIKNPTIDPFMKAEDIRAAGDARQQYNDTLAQLDYSLEQMRAENEYEKTRIADETRQGLESVNASSAARGLFNSSIRDSGLADVNATAAVNRDLLDRTLDAAVIDAQRQKIVAQQALDDFQKAMNRKMVENAAEAGEGMEYWKVKPTEDKTTKTKLKIPKPEAFGGGKPKPGKPKPPPTTPDGDYNPFNDGKNNKPKRPKKPGFKVTGPGHSPTPGPPPGGPR